MSEFDPSQFDIDVDVSPLLGDVEAPTLVSSRWYEMVRPRQGRPQSLQAKLERVLRSEMLFAQWCATSRRRLDRRRAMRVPLLSRLRLNEGEPLLSCDISLSGMRASGRPPAPLLDIEFRLPGLAFPIDARVEVVTFKDANVIPLVGLRFAWIDRPYLDHISAYIAKRRSRALAA